MATTGKKAVPTRAVKKPKAKLVKKNPMSKGMDKGPEQTKNVSTKPKTTARKKKLEKKVLGAMQ